jgi:hypothetical protein
MLLIYFSWYFRYLGGQNGAVEISKFLALMASHDGVS